MKIDQLEHADIRNDLAGAIMQAEADVAAGANLLAAAEEALAVAEAERDRVASLIGRTQSALSEASENMRALKRQSLEAVAAGAPDSKLDAAHQRAANQRAKLIDELAYLGTWPSEDSSRSVMIAELARRAAVADLFECQACRCRLALLRDAGSAFEQDPGCSIDTTNAYSTRSMAEASRIRADLIPMLEQQITRHDTRVTEERAAVSARLGV